MHARTNEQTQNTAASRCRPHIDLIHSSYWFQLSLLAYIEGYIGRGWERKTLLLTWPVIGVISVWWTRPLHICGQLNSHLNLLPLNTLHMFCWTAHATYSKAKDTYLQELFSISGRKKKKIHQLNRNAFSLKVHKALQIRSPKVHEALQKPVAANHTITDCAKDKLYL